MASARVLGFVLPVLNHPEPPNLLAFPAPAIPGPRVKLEEVIFALLLTLGSLVSVPAFPNVFHCSNWAELKKEPNINNAIKQKERKKDTERFDVTKCCPEVDVENSMLVGFIFFQYNAANLYEAVVQNVALMLRNHEQFITNPHNKIHDKQIK